MEVIYKPHPEGASKVPDDFARSFGFKSTAKRFEKIDYEIDAYVIDFFSHLQLRNIEKNKPVFFINLGFPELMRSIKN